MGWKSRAGGVEEQGGWGGRVGRVGWKSRAGGDGV